MGASPEIILTPDLYMSLERGLVEAQIFPSSGVVGFKLYEVAKYILMLDKPAGSNVRVMRQETWNILPPDIQKIIDEMSPWISELGMNAWAAYDEYNFSVAKEKGMELIYLAPEERQRLIDLQKFVEEDWAEEMDAMGLPGTEMINEQRAKYRLQPRNVQPLLEEAAKLGVGTNDPEKMELIELELGEPAKEEKAVEPFDSYKSQWGAVKIH